jgi:hypothetical protein
MVKMGKVLSWHSLGGTDNNHEKRVRRACFQAEIWTHGRFIWSRILNSSVATFGFSSCLFCILSPTNHNLVYAIILLCRSSLLYREVLPGGTWTLKTIDNYKSLESDGGMILTGENRRTWRKKPVPVPLCPQIPHGLTQARTPVSAARGRRLTTSAMALPDAVNV